MSNKIIIATTVIFAIIFVGLLGMMFNTLILKTDENNSDTMAILNNNNSDLLKYNNAKLSADEVRDIINSQSLDKYKPVYFITNNRYNTSASTYVFGYGKSSSYSNALQVTNASNTTYAGIPKVVYTKDKTNIKITDSISADSLAKDFNYNVTVVYIKRIPIGLIFETTTS